MAVTSGVSLAQLRYVVAASDAGSFRKASKTCNVSQPTLSVQVQQLEEELGLQVFDRLTRPLSVTPEGAAVVRQARVILYEVERLHALAQSHLESLEGELHLGVIATVTPFLVPRFAHAFVEAHPRLNLVVHEMKTDQIYAALDRRELDMAVVAGPVEMAQFNEVVVGREPFVGYFSPGHRLLGKETIVPEDLDLAETWLLTEGHCFRDEVLELCKARVERDPSTKRLWFESGSMETIREMVDAGQGYTLFPYLAVDGLINRHGAERIRRFGDPEPHRQLSVVFARYFNRRKIVSALVAAVRDALPEDVRSQ